MKKYLLKYKENIFLCSLLMGVSIFSEIQAALVGMNLFDAVVAGDLKLFVQTTIKTLSFWGLYLLFYYLAHLSINKTVKKMNTSLRINVSKKIADLPYSNFINKDIGEYVSWYTMDVNQIEQLAFMPLFDFINYTLQMLLAFVSLIKIHWLLGTITFVVSLAFLFSPSFFQNRIDEASSNLTVKQEKLVSKAKEMLSGLFTLKVFRAENRFTDEMCEANDVLEESKYNVMVLRTKGEICSKSLNLIGQQISQISLYVMAVLRIVPAKTVLGGVKICSMVFNGLSNMLSTWFKIMSSKSFFEKLTIEDNCKSTNKNQKLEDLSNSILLKDITFKYNKKIILNHMDCSFEIGKKYAITGPSGCGKSTLLKILLGWLPEYSGKVLLDGNDAREYTTEQLQEQMGYIEQNVFLFNTSIRENITLGENFTEEQLQKALHDSALIQDLQSMPDGLNTVVGEEGRNLSGGQKQRVAIARALIHNRSILLVDEGTSALDKKNADIVEDSLLSNPELTLILVSHHLSEERKAQFDKVYELKPVVKQ